MKIQIVVCHRKNKQAVYLEKLAWIFYRIRFDDGLWFSLQFWPFQKKIMIMICVAVLVIIIGGSLAGTFAWERGLGTASQRSFLSHAYGSDKTVDNAAGEQKMDFFPNCRDCDIVSVTYELTMIELDALKVEWMLEHYNAALEAHWHVSSPYAFCCSHSLSLSILYICLCLCMSVYFCLRLSTSISLSTRSLSRRQPNVAQSVGAILVCWL